MKIYMHHVRGTKRNFLLGLLFKPLAWVSGWVIALLDFLRAHGLLKTEEPPLCSGWQWRFKKTGQRRSITSR